MREQLIRYVELLFAGAPNSEEIKQEILQNTLDRYDDLVSQGKQPEAAYRLAIGGIGDINEILGSGESRQAPRHEVPVSSPPQAETKDDKDKKQKRAVAVALYILCPVPLFILGDVGNGVMGLCLMFLLIAAATALLIMAGEESSAHKEPEPAAEVSPSHELRKAVNTGITTVGFVVYFVLSFVTQAWYITWLVFPIMAAVRGLVKAIFDLKEAGKHEN